RELCPLLPPPPNWAPIVFPTVGAAGTDFTPSRSARNVNVGRDTSFQLSTAGVTASVPVPAIGQIAVVSNGTGAGTVVPPPSSAFTIPVARLGVQARLCQSGALSLRTPKFEPPTISK